MGEGDADHRHEGVAVRGDEAPDSATRPGVRDGVGVVVDGRQGNREGQGEARCRGRSARTVRGSCEPWSSGRRRATRASRTRYRTEGRVAYGALEPFGEYMGQMAVATVADLIREATNGD